MATDLFSPDIPASAPMPQSERWFTAAAWLYLALLPCHLPLVGPLMAHDLLAPVFVAAVLRRGDWCRWRRSPDGWLAAFLAWAVLATLAHGLPGRADLYEFAVFAYVALIYAFFSRTRLNPRGLGLYAGLVVAGFWAVAVIQAAGGYVHPHSAYVGTTLGFLATRYGFTFGNPNLLAPFAVLPLVCALLASTGAAGQGTGTPLRLRLARRAAFLVAFAVPVLLTASRHLLMTLALLLGGLLTQVPLPWRRGTRALAWALLGGTFVLFYLTVLFPFFPLRAEPPFINARAPGMYMVHQHAYLRMATADLRRLAVGLGPDAIRAEYPHQVDPDLARRSLLEYHMPDLIPSFLVYMDAHNEYLNLATDFGLPAVLLMAAFLLALARRPVPGLDALLPLLIAAIGCACLWDDLLSKRWIWVALGLLAAAAQPSPRAMETRPPTPNEERKSLC